MTVVLLLGGVRSGKSRLAVELAVRASAPVTMIATGQGRDADMTSRIARHRAERPADWTTVEEPIDVSAAVDHVPGDHTVVLDCLTLWVSNLMERELSDEAIAERAHEAAERAARRSGLVVVVTNEVGSGVIPESPLGRRFSEILGRVNTIWAAVADRSALVVAGKILALHEGGDLLDD